MGSVERARPGWGRERAPALGSAGLRAVERAPGVETGEGFLCFPPVPPTRFCFPGGVQKRGLSAFASMNALQHYSQSFSHFASAAMRAILKDERLAFRRGAVLVQPRLNRFKQERRSLRARQFCCFVVLCFVLPIAHFNLYF